MKGGVAAILGAVRAVAETTDPDRLAGEVLVAFVPSEEDGGQGMLAAIRAGVTGDLAVITEPSNLDVVVAHAGALTFRLTVPGRAAHASQRREGISALDNLWALARALEADETRRNAEETDPLMTALGLPYPTIVGIVRGGEWASTVIDRIVADGRYGVRLGQSPEHAEEELRACVDAACAEHPFLRDHPATVEIVGGRFGSARVPSDHPLPVASRRSERVTGRRPELLGEPYGADMRLLVNEGRTPTVIFGPGDVRVAHSADERVPLAEVEPAPGSSRPGSSMPSPEGESAAGVTADASRRPPVELVGRSIVLVPVRSEHVDALVRIIDEPSVAAWWTDTETQFRAGLLEPDPDETAFAILSAARDAVIGFIQATEELEPGYRHAGVDLFVATAHQGRGVGPEAIRLVVRWLIDERGHHRVTIDPAVANVRAIRAYEKVGFRRVGVLRQYERGRDDSWHDGLLMDLLASELSPD